MDIKLTSGESCLFYLVMIYYFFKRGVTMLDYTYGKDDKQSFICDYKIIDSDTGSKIGVVFANGDKRVVPYSLVTESKILKKMHRQAEWASVHYKSSLSEKAGICSALVWAMGFISSFRSLDIPGYTYIASFFTGPLLFPYLEKKQELRKYRYFLEQEEYINHYLPLTNEHAFSGLNHYSINKIYDKADRFSESADEDIIDIKLVDGMTLIELKMLRGNIERELCLGPVREEIDTFTPQKVKKQNNVLGIE